MVVQIQSTYEGVRCWVLRIELAARLDEVVAGGRVARKGLEHESNWRNAS
jgi:hypothetical protein